MRNKILYPVYLLGLVGLVSFFSGSISAESNSFSLSAFVLKYVRLGSTENGASKLELSPRDRKEGSDLFLDFEEKEAADLNDKAGGYRILTSSYLPDAAKAHSGKRSAGFVGKRSGIKVSGKTKGILTSPDIKEEFYISFFLLPGNLDKEAILLSKDLYTRGKKFGWDLRIKDEIPILEFRNFFQKADKTHLSLKLAGNSRLSRSDWNHFIIHFKPVQREIVLYINGKETDRASVSSKEPIIRIGFHPEDSTPFKIGESFYGWLDDFLVSKGSPDPEVLSTQYDGQKYDPSSFTADAKFGTAISPVYKTKFSNSIPEAVLLKANVPKSSVLELYFRSSPKIFSKTEEYPAWRSIDLRKIEEEFKEDDPYRETEEESSPKGKSSSYRIPLDKVWGNKLSYFKYYQVKVKFKTDSGSKSSPELEALTFSYRETIPPVRPAGLKIVNFDDYDPEAQGPKVCLSWTQNPERNVQQKGGYVIHYGVGPNRMVGILKGTSKELAKGKMPVLTTKGKTKHPMSEYLDPILGDDSTCPKRNDMSGPKLCQCIDNRLISLNAEKPEENDDEDENPKPKKKKPKPRKDPYDKKLLFFQKGLTYYFKVAAYNSVFDPENGPDQLSPLSDSVEVYFLSE
ncbi:hypothetical protein EHQ52_08880 [Leptospira koniambonensis]|uniref:Glucanase n=1 Tax=Leptospira koniambonensis TaxID=2484950 RepID=A0A4R9J9K1_9LEPT|nr:hypothetical protein [Leptospira koniambonensis]TGL34602.1 hypothetical protein EHQ52_08880 [Leptospira koniambonensis]